MSEVPDPSAHGIFTHRRIEALLASGAVGAERPFEPIQIQPTSLDLRLGSEAWAVRAGFLPGREPVERRVRRLLTERLDLSAGAVLERGHVYLVRLLEHLALPAGVAARANPRSSTGRIDVFTRTLVDGYDRFDDVPAGYHGPLWVEVAPRSFDVRVETGQRLNQMRFLSGDPLLDARTLAARLAEGLVPGEGEPRLVDPACVLLGLSLVPDEPGAPVGWRARPEAPVLDVSRERGHPPHAFFEPVHAEPDGTLVLEPEAFYILASRRRLRLPPDLAAEMLPWDVGMGELRTNYAGFFDPGFGWEGPPSRAVLEVRAHDVPFRVEHGQAIFRLQFSRTIEACERLYGGSGSAYQGQGLALARYFETPR